MKRHMKSILPLIFVQSGQDRIKFINIYVCRVLYLDSIIPAQN